MSHVPRTLVLGSLLLFLPQVCFGHFLWISAERKSPTERIHVHFSEAPEPDDPALLDRLGGLSAWKFQAGKFSPVKLKKGEDSLEGDAGAANAETVYGLQHSFGVQTRDGNAFLLQYYAKCYPTADVKTWKDVGDPKQLPLEVSAQVKGKRIELRATWLGQPVEGALFHVDGDSIDKLDGTSDAGGHFLFDADKPGRYWVRCKFVEQKSGQFQEQPFASIRHYSTLTFSLAQPAGGKEGATVPQCVVKPAENLPPLERGLTSFGAAVVGNVLYVYGGHFGKPHHYGHEGQSGQLLALDLANPERWTQVSEGPKRTGLALVTHNGKLYRIGGFEAKNSEKDVQDLWSSADFASYDLATKAWRELPSLPEPRSSHDAVVIGNTLYVCGGWKLTGKDNNAWHETAWAIDLGTEPLTWRQLPKPPFRRRALSLGEWQGKLYVLGGMQEDGGPTTKTAAFDPQSGEWTEGPVLAGEAMDGFGSSAFARGGGGAGGGQSLFVTTISGKVQRLSDDRSHWDVVGQLGAPRFFHRLVPVDNHKFLVVGGADMKTGKVRELEQILLPK